MDELKKGHLTHDAFFRAMMGKPEVAKEFLQQYLPPELIAQLDFSTIKQESCHFITPALRPLAGDVLFSIRFNQQIAYILALVEHLSTKPRTIAIHNFLYKAIAMHHFADYSREKPLPLVIPFVIYHGKHPYRQSTDIRDYIDAPRQLIDCYFDQPFQLIDLTVIEDEALVSQRVWSVMMQLALKHIRDKDALPFTEFLLKKVIKPLDQVKDSEKLELVLTYLLDQANIPDKESFTELVHSTLEPNLEEHVMTTMVQHWQEEGRLMGRQEGRQEARHSI